MQRIPENDEDFGQQATINNDDDKILADMGYESELYRGLSSFANFAFGFTEVGVLASIVSLYGYGLTTGGNHINPLFFL